ncbi:hypothetical protein O181_126059 [Austropuccinia psidii MF-1]|uniref:Uncharacterized protein n=1 Tax=Austropuccinia psidii MF-1 TaxID=1389203 RepID=A0A9Q3KVB5_9BASI|nr:hypothetical protein [Austropuccinia psidii MF-1]
MSLKAQTHCHTIHNVWVITPHGATQQFGMARLPPHCLHAYAPAPPPDETPALPPHIRPHHSLPFRTPASYSSWLTILMLLRGPQVMPPTLPSPPLTPPCTRLTLSTAYHPYVCIAATRHASNTAYHPYTCMAPP